MTTQRPPFPFKKFDNPESINRYVSGQKDVVSKIRASSKKVIILSAPTGVGKSLIAMMCGNYMAHTTNYICTTKVLQNQLENDFKEAVIMKGRVNYQCNKFWTKGNNVMADDCVSRCIDVKKGIITCDYEDAKSAMMSSKYRILNTAYWLTEINYVGKLSGQKLVVIDEVDRLDSQTVSFVGLVISKSDIYKYGLKPPIHMTKVESWKDWGKKTYVIVDKKFPGSMKKEERDKEIVKGYRFKRKVVMFNSLVDDTWIFEKTKFGSWVFKPIWISKELGQEYIWKHADKFILMSATPPMPSSIGLNNKDVEMIEIESSYPVENRWVYYNGVVDMSYKNRKNHSDILPHVQNIMDKFKDKKGIIHTCSYKLRDMVMNSNVDVDRFVTHDASNKEEKMKEFLADKTNKIFLSPSSERGTNLIYDKGRFCIWLKVPFGNLGDKQIAARAYSKPFGSEWYIRDAMQTIVQGCGRVMRADDDWGFSYILDSQFGSVESRKRSVMSYCPEWFLKGLIVGSGL